MPVYEPSKRRLTWPNGVIATIFSGDEPDQLRGPAHGSAWVDELAKFKYPQDTWDNLVMGLRLGPQPQAVITSTPRPIPIIRQLLADTKNVDTVGSSYENAANLSETFIANVIRMYEGTRLGRQELYGEVLGDVPGALWTRDTLETTRVRSVPGLRRIVIGVDPAVTANEETSSETGIVIGGVDENDHGYLLEDLSGIYTPAEWARLVIHAYDRHLADAVVAEVNNGGDLVERNLYATAEIMFLRGERRSKEIRVKQVRAAKGKYVRAEPVSSLYEQGRVHHVGMFAELEDQLCVWLPGEDSPDRLDATVWAMTDLMLHDTGMDAGELAAAFGWQG
jgi:phage terminase large subunit-like protein